MYLDFNLGSSIAKVCSTGISGDIHFQIAPRLEDDTNFMLVVGQGKVITNDLHGTYDNIKPHCDR